MKLVDYVARLTEELAHTPFGSNELVLGVITEAAWRAGGCTCSRRGSPLDDGNPVYAADVTCPVHPIHCRTDGVLDHERPTALVDGEPRCDFCQRVMGGGRSIVPFPTLIQQNDPEGSTSVVSSNMPQAWAELIEGLTMLAKHQSDEVSPMHYEHDTLRVMADSSSCTTEELARLEAMGFHADGDDGGFYSFRFGRA